MDIIPIIPDEPKQRREPYNLALCRLIRDNDHKIISSFVKFHGSTIHIELDIQAEPDTIEKLQSIKELEIKEEPLYKAISKDQWASAEEFIKFLKERGGEPMRYQGDNPF